MVPRQGRTRRLVAIAAVLAVLASLSLAGVAAHTTGAKDGERTDAAAVSAQSLLEARRPKKRADAVAKPTVREVDATDVVVEIVEEVKVEESSMRILQQMTSADLPKMNRAIVLDDDDDDDDEPASPNVPGKKKVDAVKKIAGSAGVSPNQVVGAAQTNPALVAKIVQDRRDDDDDDDDDDNNNNNNDDDDGDDNGMFSMSGLAASIKDKVVGDLKPEVGDNDEDDGEGYDPLFPGGDQFEDDGIDPSRGEGLPEGPLPGVGEGPLPGVGEGLPEERGPIRDERGPLRARLGDDEEEKEDEEEEEEEEEEEILSQVPSFTMIDPVSMLQATEEPSWEAPPPAVMTTEEKKFRSKSVDMSLRSRAATDPSLAGFMCSPIGVSIQSMDGTIFYNSEARSSKGGGTATKCLWLLDFPPAMSDDTLIALRVNSFSSASPATLKAFSGMQTCQDDDTMYMKYHIGEGGVSSLERVKDAYVFVPVRGNSVAIELDVESEAGDGFTGYELDMSYFPLSTPFRQRNAANQRGNGRKLAQSGAPNSANDTVSKMPEIEFDNGVFPGYFAITEGGGLRRFGELVDENDAFGQMTGVEYGIFIVNNPDFVSLDGIQDKVRSVTNGPIIISNNPRLHMPIAAVIDWLNTLEGNVSSIDLTFNNFYGPIPESYCELIKRVPNVNIGQNINICGRAPSCVSELESAVLSGDSSQQWNLVGKNETTFRMSKDENADILGKYVQLWVGTSLGETCALSGEGVSNTLTTYSNANSSRTSCSPMGHTAKLDRRGGDIFFDSLSIEMQQFKDTSCAWEANHLRMSRRRDRKSILLLEFNSFYTSINGNQGLCNDFSSGHDFYNPMLNGPSTDEFVVSVYNETYKRGLDVYFTSGSEVPPPFALKIDPSYVSAKMSLVTTSNPINTFDYAESMNRSALQPCGNTSVTYTFIQPITTLANLTRFVNRNVDNSTGEIRKSIVLSSCEAVNGSRIEDLSALKDVTKITGDLIIMDCPTLTSLNGASKLRNISKSLIIKSNPNLRNVSGLSSLEYVGGSFTLEENTKLRSFAGLGKLKDIGASLGIEMSQFRSLRGLGGLESIGGQLIVTSNDNMRTLKGLDSLTRIGATAMIKYNQMLEDLSGLHLLQEIGGSLDVQLNSKLMNLTGLENLKTVRGSFAVFNNPELTNIEQLLSLAYVGGSFLVGSNENLRSLELPVVKSIGSPIVLDTGVDGTRKNRNLLASSGAGRVALEESSNHIFAVEYNPILERLDVSTDIESLPWNVYIGNNPYLSGFLPWHLLTVKSVRQANLGYNNFSGPISPQFCDTGGTVEALILNGNTDICGSLPDNCHLQIAAVDTNLGKACKDTVAPVCALKEARECAVNATDFSSSSTELLFMFPEYQLVDEMAKSFNTSVEYQFGVGTKPDIANVNPYRKIDSNLIKKGPIKGMIQHSWNIKDRHISLINGQTYYILVNAYDLTGVTGRNITSKGTLIDMMQPDVTNAQVVLDVDLMGHYTISWGGFESTSGIKDYEVVLTRNAKPFNTTTLPGSEGSMTGLMGQGNIVNGTTFTAEVIGVSKAGLRSPSVKSASVMPMEASDGIGMQAIILVAVGVTLGCLLTGGIVTFFVMRHLKKQKEKAKEDKWFSNLNNSVYTFLQGTGTSAGKLSSEEGSVCLSSDKSQDSDKSKDRVFVFTDIQSSTKLCEQDADAYLLLQEAHDEVMRNALAEVGGHEVDTEGDAFQCMFPNVVTSLLFCFKVQEDLLEYDWPPSVLALHECGKVKSTLHRNKYIWAGPRVRMAVHFARGGTYLAKSHPTTRRVAYGGTAWKTAMSLSDVGHGGQILVSEQAWRHLTAFGEEGAAGYPIFEDLGRYQIEDFEICAPMRILQVSPARSSISERIFSTLRDVDMLDAGHGMNIVPSIDGKAAIVCAIIEPSRFVHIIENFITVVGKREAASNNAPIDEEKPWKKASMHDADTVPSCRSPVIVPEYDNSAHTTKRTLDRSLSLQENREQAVELTPMDALGFREAQKTIYFTDEHQQAVDIVCTSIEALVSQFGGYLIRTVEGVDVPQQVMVIAFKSSSSAVRFTLAAQTTLMEYPWPKSINEAFGNSKVSTLSRDGTPLFNGPCVAMSAHVDLIEKFSLFGSQKLQRSMSSDHKVSYKYAGILPALELAHIASGGQTVLSSSFFDSKWQKGLSLSQTQVTDLGVHDVRYFSQPEKLIEILPKILQDRSDVFLPLNSQRILSVGAQNAPGAHGEPVALVFTYPRVARAFQKSDIANQAVDNFSEAVRILLARYNGYESQEVGTGCFFLSFPSIEDAVSWGIHLQLVLRRSDWNNSESFLRMNDLNKNSTPKEMEANIYEVFKRNSSDKSSQASPGVLIEDEHGASTGDRTDDMEDTLFSFASTHHSFPNMSLMMRHLVLVQIGICYGMPTKVTPHVQTGRADYFGPIVNLSARVAKGTKPGDVHLSSYTDLDTDDVLKPGPEYISWRGDRSVGPPSSGGSGDGGDGHQACYLKGMEFANEGKWVDINLNDEGYFAFKGVKDKRKVLSVKVASDPFGYSANSTPNV